MKVIENRSVHIRTPNADNTREVKPAAPPRIPRTRKSHNCGVAHMQPGPH